MTSTATLTRPQTELLQRRAAHQQMRARLIEKPHPEDATVGTPYYDEELDVAQSLAHHKTVQKLGELLDRVAAWEGLQSIGDNPVWYWDADEDCQRILYPDYALTDAENLGSVTAKSLLLAIEVVTTTHRRKEEKDTIKMRNWNELNAVPEFLLLYPEPDDPRGLIAYRYNQGSSRLRKRAAGTTATLCEPGHRWLGDRGARTRRSVGRSQIARVLSW
jgi:hypothetical protein